MKLLCGYLFLGLAVSLFGQEKTASLSLHNLSLHFYQSGNGVMERTFWAGQFRGRHGLRPVNGTEVRPRPEADGIYEANYVISQSGARLEYGRMALSIPAIDSDANGVPDIVQREKAFDAPVTGALTADFIAVERITLPEFAGRISRAANTLSGDYKLDLYADGGSAVSSFKILDGSGAITYNRGPRNTVTLTPRDDGELRIFGSTTFKVLNENEVVLRAFVSPRGYGPRVIHRRLHLKREGDRYIGLQTLPDGNPETPGRDFRRSLVQIIDAHDSDGDGVPDLSDLENNRAPYSGNILTWGHLTDGLNDIPLAASNIIAIAAGDGHSLALRADGKVFAWGRNDFGQANVPAAATNVVAIAAGNFHSLAARADGTVIGWGLSFHGQANAQVFDEEVVALSGGHYHSLALTRDRRVTLWGYNGIQGFPPLVPATATNVTAIATHSHYNIALRGDGTIVTWGSVYNGTNYGSATPPVDLRDLKSIAAGQDFGLGLSSNGTVVAWGYMRDATGLYGNAYVPDNLSNVVSIAAGARHCLAITSDGQVVSWGWDRDGNLPVPSFVTNATVVAIGTVHSLAITRGP